MIRLKAANIVSVRLLGTAQAKKRIVKSVNGQTIPFGIIDSFFITCCLAESCRYLIQTDAENGLNDFTDRRIITLEM